MSRAPKLKRLKLIAAVFIILSLLFVFGASPAWAVATWVSYNDAARTVEDNTFASPETTAYMKGTGYTASTAYRVAYYEADTDGAGAGDEADLLAWEQKNSNASGVLQSAIIFSEYDLPTTDAGTWHSVVYTTADTPPSVYNATTPSPVADDTFTVNADAIPEFPTVMAMIVAMVLSFGIYFWMRKKYRRQAVTA